jgi:hypothetical protein
MSTVYFTYHLYHIPTGLHYYGARWKKGCHPKDLFVSYFSSSSKVLSLIEEYGKDSFSYEIRKTFNSESECRDWEEKVLKRLGVPKNNKWINKATRMPTMFGKSHTEETKNKMRKPKGSWSQERKDAWSKRLKEKYKKGEITTPDRTGSKHTTETKKKMSRTAWNKGIPNPAASENGKRGAAKLSKTVTGRKRKYISETKWVWEYPTD